MLLLILAVIAARLLPVAVRLAADVVATAIAIGLAVQARRATRAILAMREAHDHRPGGFANQPSRAERRAMAASLRVAIRQTELISLLPHTAARAERMVAIFLG